MLDTLTRVAPREVTTGYAAVLRTVVKRFTDTEGREFTAVDGLDLRVGRGEVVAFLGPNGAGKTTTIDMILGLVEPDAGSVELFGLPPRQAVRSGRVAAVLQTGGLLPDLTVESTVRMIASLYPGADPEHCIDRAGISELRARKVSSCSGGEQQRLRFAVALLSDPEFLVLDEPTAGMDVGARREFWAAVRQDAERGMTVLFATHYLEEADQFADRVVMIDKGTIVADGSASAIRATVSGRAVSAVLDRRDARILASTSGVRSCEERAGRYHFDCADSDGLVRRLVTETAATDIEVTPRSLEEAFLAITDQARTVRGQR